MKNIIKTILFLSLACLISLVFTYCISLFDMWFDFGWLSNAFLLAISGGIFASLFVLLVVEIKKYFDVKSNLQNIIYTNCLLLYAELHIQIQSCASHLSQKDKQVPEKLFELRLPYIAQLRNALASIDYKTLGKNNAVEKAFIVFQKNTLMALDDHMNLCIYLPLSINETRLAAAVNGCPNYVASAKDPLVMTTLQKLKANASAIMAEINNTLDILSSCYPSRYNWGADKAKIDSAQNSFEDCVRKFFEE